MSTSLRMHGNPLVLLLPLWTLAACTTDQPTAPATSGGTPAAAAGQRVVTSLADPGNGTCDARQCTLREAINDPGSTAITFAPGLTGPITLAPPAAGGGPLRIDRSVTITGPSGGLLIRRRSTDPAFRILRVGTEVTVRLDNLTIRGGKTDLGGGGVINYGTLTLANSRVTDNESTKHGGGIDNYGPLTVTNSVVARNKGGGIANHNDMTVTLTQSTVTRNEGNGISDGSGSLVLRHSAITYNTGVGISKSRETVALDHVRIVGNTGGGVFLGAADMTMTSSTIARNSTPAWGGGILINRATLTITNSTISGNSAAGNGGGIFAGSSPRAGVIVRLTNTTVSGNSAAVGGGIYSEDDFAAPANVHLVSTTIAYNTATQSGGGIGLRGSVAEDEGAWLDMVNSLVGQNAAPAAPDINPGLPEHASASHSLIADGTASGLANEGGNLVGNVPPYAAPIDPLLELLDQNGGPTLTHALKAGSPAIDAGTAEACPATDQRGVSRPQGNACDIGSFERQ